MNLFSCVVARDFRTLFGRCVRGRPRGPAPPVVVQFQGGVRTLATTAPSGVHLTHTLPAPDACDEVLVVPGPVLAAVEGPSDVAVMLSRDTQLHGVVAWTDRAGPRSWPVELILPGKQHEIPAPPTLSEVSPELPLALHECGRTTAREGGRYALSQVQLQGEHGRVVGTDGKVALLWTGLSFPFHDDVLVLVVPVFGARPLARFRNASVGRTGTHLVVGLGPWSVWLPTDTTARYPDVAAVVPRDSPTSVAIDARDAAEALAVLPGLPGRDHEFRPITLGTGAAVCVCGYAEGGEVRQVTLARSSATGPPVRVVLDRRVLIRALALGCHTIRLTPDRPVVLEGTHRMFVAAPLDAEWAAPVAEGPEPQGQAFPERRRPVKPEPTGPVSPGNDPPDPLDLAEALRSALSDAASTATRLVAALRSSRKEKRLLSTVLSNLKQLNLGGAS